MQVTFSYTVQVPGFYSEYTQVRDVFEGYIRWNLEYWNPATDPPIGDAGGSDYCASKAIGTCFQAAFSLPDPDYPLREHDSWEDGVSWISASWAADRISFYWESYFFIDYGTESLELFGDFTTGLVTGGSLWLTPWDETFPYAMGTVNPHAVPEPSTLAALIAGCLALAIGYRSGEL
jgi:hypothetical protein